ncbi:MAG: WYL domain-containing protein [Candidatus Nitronauta litoralis]|uniref:WYL domain-containing protein n=1 Tax=Candidatus Nitronauta litoralis TaxID=2705533 RepID=A0A7T0BWT9_9BACT|nr:MAG: WYL domain-containing protein [Candidatus Nitronauta litoralis]
MLTPRQKMAQVVYLLLTDPGGFSYSFLKDNLEVNDRALRVFIQELKNIPELHDSQNQTRVQVTGRGPDRRVFLKPLDIEDTDTIGHVLSLQFAHTMLRFLKGTQLENYLTKMSASFLQGPDKQLFVNLDKKIFSINEWPKDYSNKSEIIKDCLHSLLYRKSLKVQYKSPGSKQGKAHELNIYTLLQYRNGLYLIAKSDKGPKVMVFAAERIIQTQKTRKEFRYPPKYSPEDYVDGAFGLIKWEEESHKVVINFDSDLETAITARKWHKSQSIKKLKDGTIQLSMTVSALEQVVPWVLSFGSLAKVLKPKSLKEQVVTEIGVLFNQYKKR